jgi:hypothetical protein
VRFRVYLASGSRDYDASKIDLGADGSLVLTKLTKVGSRPDLQRGGMQEEWESRILAIIGPDGRVRAETIDEAGPLVEGGRVTILAPDN